MSGRGAHTKNLPLNPIDVCIVYHPIQENTIINTTTTKANVYINFLFLYIPSNVHC